MAIRRGQHIMLVHVGTDDDTEECIIVVVAVSIMILVVMYVVMGDWQAHQTNHDQPVRHTDRQTDGLTSRTPAL